MPSRATTGSPPAPSFKGTSNNSNTSTNPATEIQKTNEEKILCFSIVEGLTPNQTATPTNRAAERITFTTANHHSWWFFIEKSTLGGWIKIGRTESPIGLLSSPTV